MALGAHGGHRHELSIWLNKGLLRDIEPSHFILNPGIFKSIKAAHSGKTAGTLLYQINVRVDSHTRISHSFHFPTANCKHNIVRRSIALCTTSCLGRKEKIKQYI